MTIIDGWFENGTYTGDPVLFKTGLSQCTRRYVPFLAPFLHGLTIIWIWALYSRKTYGTVSQFLLMITHNFLSVIAKFSTAGQNNQQPMSVLKPLAELLNDCWIGGCVGRKSSTLCRICVRVQDVSALSGYNFLLPMRIDNAYRQYISVMQIANANSQQESMWQ